MVQKDTIRFDAHDLLTLSKNLRKVAGNKSESEDRGAARTFRGAVKKVNVSIAELISTRAKANAAARRQSQVVAEDPAAFHTSGTAERAAAFLTSTSQYKEHDPQSFVLGSEYGAKQNVERYVNVKVERKLREDIKPKAKTRNAYYKVYDFSGARKMKGWNQFQPWRGSRNVAASGDELNAITGIMAVNFASNTSHARTDEDLPPGYWLTPAVRDGKPDFAAMYANAYTDVFQDAVNQTLLEKYVPRA